MSITSISISILAGIIPSLLWLWFWLKEDRKHPEPRKKIILSFFLGMFAVLLVLPVEKLLYSAFGSSINAWTLTSWAAAEEILKFVAAYFFCLRYNKYNDEPIDAVIYLISAALGFSALENSLFLLNNIGSGLITQSIISGNMRFMGATLLHTISSGTIGMFMAFGFYLNKEARKMHLFLGLLSAIALHAIFNWLIIKSGQNLFFIFGGVWLGVISLILIFEKIKTISR